MAEQPSMQLALSRFLPSYQQHRRLSPVQGKVCHSILACRTAELGGQLVLCDHCGFEQHRYHSCRNRHCPKCQHNASQQWCERQLQQVLPVNYFHLVFTLPHTLNPWVQCHPETVYRCLFHSVWHTIKSFGADPKRLNGKMGMTAVLHTWGQNLSQHVHLHCLIPGGAYSQDRQWHEAKSNYLFPVKALSRHFRGTLVSALRRAHREGHLDRIRSDDIDACLHSLMHQNWVVYAKNYLKQASTIIRYLGRYTHKIAISDRRIKEVNDTHVTFAYKDYRDNKDKRMQLEGKEFIRRFLLHVLPHGLMRVRHYGFLSNRSRQKQLENIRACLSFSAQKEDEQAKATDSRLTPDPGVPCPKCHQGHLRFCVEIPKPGKLKMKMQH